MVAVSFNKCFMEVHNVTYVKENKSGRTLCCPIIKEYTIIFSSRYKIDKKINNSILMLYVAWNGLQ